MTLEERADALSSASSRLSEAQRLVMAALYNLVDQPVSETRTAAQALKAIQVVEDAKMSLAKLTTKL